jgi:hypothetical protein
LERRLPKIDSITIFDTSFASRVLLIERGMFIALLRVIKAKIMDFFGNQKKTSTINIIVINNNGIVNVNLRNK